MLEAKGCPFCGAEVLSIDTYSRNLSVIDTVSVRRNVKIKTNCLCSVFPWEHSGYGTKEEVTAKGLRKWNRRTRKLESPSDLLNDLRKDSEFVGLCTTYNVENDAQKKAEIMFDSGIAFACRMLPGVECFCGCHVSHFEGEPKR